MHFDIVKIFAKGRSKSQERLAISKSGYTFPSNPFVSTQDSRREAQRVDGRSVSNLMNPVC